MRPPCREVQPRFDGWLFGTLADSEAAALELHVKECARCRRAFADEASIFADAHVADVGVQESETELQRKAEFLERGAALLRERSALLQQQRAEAPNLIDELLRHPQERRLTMVANLERFHSWGLCETLVDRSETARPSSPEQGLAFAQLAVAVANALDQDFYRGSLVSDLIAQSWAAVAASRVELRDVAGATAAIEEAVRYGLEGTGDPLLEADIAFVEATVRAAQGQFAESLDLFDDAECLWRRFRSDGSWEERIAAARVEAILAELLTKTQHDRLQSVDIEPGYHSRLVCEALIERAREAAYDDASLAIEWGELAVLATNRLDPKVHVASLVADIHGRALTALANAKRAGSDLPGAEASFGAARTELERGTGDPLEEAYYYHCWSALRLWQRRFPEAFRYINHAIAIYRRIKDQHLEGT